jgi:hypothetical protein
MPIFFFSVRHGEDARVCNDDGAEFPDRNAAWKEMTGVCGDMVGEISRGLVENAEWQMELLDESRKPVFRIRLVAETLENTDKKTPTRG